MEDHVSLNCERTYFMFYTDDIIFIHNSLTGGKSISRAFGQPDGEKRFRGNVIGAHATATETKAVMGEEEWNRHWSFSVVRNPWDRMVSMLHHYRRTPKLQKHWGGRWRDVYAVTHDLRSFVHFYPPTLYGQSGGIRTPQLYWTQGVDEVFKFEEIHTTLAEAMRERGYSGEITTSYPTIDKPIRPYQDYYDEDLKNVVAEYYRDDIEAFGYSFQN